MSKQPMNGGEIVVATLLSRGVEAVFFVPGGTYTTVLECLSRHGNEIRSVPTRLESSAAFAAEAYSAVARKPAAVFVTRAPGAANAVIGVHNAMQASRPMVLFIANIPRRLKGREAFQEIDHQQMFAPVAKAVLDVNSINELADVCARAIDLSVAGRPGPVVCVVSRDILEAKLEGPAIPRAPAPVRLGPDPDDAARAARLIEAARRPILIPGEMVAFEGASDDLVRFADATGAGVLTAYRHQDVLPNDHPSFFGQMAINRLPHQEAALKDCDLIVAIGTRLDSVTSANYSIPGTGHKLVMIYPEPAVFSQWRADVAIGSHVRPALAAIQACLLGPAPADRVAWRDEVHAKEAAFAAPGGITIHGTVDLGAVIRTLGAELPPETIHVADAGTFGRWIQRFYRFSRPGTGLGPVSGAMGYGLPGAIGARIADARAPIFAWAGDGGFLMTGNEMAVLAQEGLPIKVIVCDNEAWGSILVDQHKSFGDDWDFGSRLKSPDFAALSRGFGIPAWTVAKTDEFAAALAGAMAEPGPALIHLKLDARDVSPYPKALQ